ncbi:ribonuclease J [Candidatus Gracilibacteria bacterium]|nr:ribonuclease J [Candidatus Gracilibacteria bacterium]
MTKNLNQWLGKQGLLGANSSNANSTKRPNTQTQSKVTAPVPTPAPTRTGTKTSPSAQKPSEKKHFSPAKPTQRRKSSPYPMKSRENRFTSHDPTMGRPTREKREKFHPTNFMNGGNKGDIRVIPLGGLEQVGENMMFLEWENDIVIIDTGIEFPSAEHLGVDVLVPDISYLRAKRKNIRGVIYTHGHLDHIGGVPYILPELGFPPIYATRLTKELILANSSEHGIANKLKISEITPQSRIRLGKFDFEFFHINHSVPDGVGIVVNTPYGKIVHTSDFKIDYNPSDDQPADLGRIAKIGKEGVVLALVDSTNALKEGHTLSESVIEAELSKLIRQTPGRAIVTTFASSIGRISKIVEAAERDGRTVFLSGRSMERNLSIARKLNYLKCKEGTMQLMSRKAETMDPKKVLILSTGSQGEELAALTRMAAGTHKNIKLKPADTVIFSSSPIPGNELAVVSVMNNLAEIGVKMYDKKKLDIHVSGHAYADECKLMTSLLNPKYFSPIHGEPYMRYGHRDMVVHDLGFKPENTFVMKNGQGVVLNNKGARLMTDREAIPAPQIMLELGEKIGQHVISDRTLMSDSGAIFAHIQNKDGKVQKVDIRSRGFIYMGMQHEIFNLLGTELKQVFERNYDPSRSERALEETLQKSAQKILYQKFKKDVLVEVVI